ncbi:ubiquinol-cytochrome-c reductase complex assembly factor 1 isoform X2 [Pseudomyrmex gracilis]|uniref:ubiquinol-cytochrome-c reductase complex assembly factor 1 isoform X2 n=1 Tax=Pseudomyrmex gracilis TaxID=219809 RepID=UPI0009956710|nr:ubiquinol-cytochrome-c reductase complex assembly factor 1 isoform X2 [Pseudomyrmex gracilis]
MHMRSPVPKFRVSPKGISRQHFSWICSCSSDFVFPISRVSRADPRQRKKGESSENKNMFTVQHTRTFFSLKNATLMLTQRTTQNDLVRLFAPVCATHLPEFRNIYTTSSSNTSIAQNIRPMGVVQKTLKKFGILDIQKYKDMALGTKVYEDVLGQIDYPFFFKYFNMPDTFCSWFLVTELHVWMIMVRYMAEGKTGKAIRNHIAMTLWSDLKARVDKLGPMNSKVKQNQLKEVTEQFHAAIIGYDEGILSNDRVLAAAIWRRFFHLECNNPEHVEVLLIYIRKQICLFDNLPTHEILRKPVLKLIDIKSLCKNR